MTGDTDGGRNVGYIDADDWIDYAVKAASDGVYSVEFRVASQITGNILL